ncbi:MAG: hypothetical protein BRD49_04445 [Bacteroidetes bacterium SW_10_40_5]|nr:MAG: hypothetical protein BRD49_04445 [Bacteroidetes bacterium SW_10_40_5]
MRFIFRDGQSIDASNSIYEIMSLEPTGEVGVGDFSSTGKNPESRLHVDVENTNQSDTSILVTDGNQKKTFMVRNDGLVGIDTTEQVTSISGVDFTVNGEAEKNTPGNGTWTTPSDKRLKKNIKPFEDGLNTLMQIEPKRFELNDKYGKREGKEGIGVIAQEIREVAPYMVYGEEKEDEYLGYSANALWYILVNAVQEQQKQLKEEKAKSDSLIRKQKAQNEILNNQQQQINNQQEQIDQLRTRLNRLAKQKDGNANRFQKSDDLNKKTVSISDQDGENQAMLLQNRPNPYSGETIIPYYLPKDFNNANMLITNTNGQIIKRVDLENPGKGELTLRTKGLKAGQYLYSLIVDGRKIQTRKMVLSKR